MTGKKQSVITTLVVFLRAHVRLCVCARLCVFMCVPVCVCVRLRSTLCVCVCVFARVYFSMSVCG